MDINRTGPRKPHLENPAQKAERTDAQFKSPASQPIEPSATAPPPGVPPGVTPADLRDPRRVEEILMRCFGGLLDDAGHQLGVAVSDVQRRNLLEFLGNDPVMRGKLLKYLGQVVK
jgi:hypothetical protein